MCFSLLIKYLHILEIPLFFEKQFKRNPRVAAIQQKCFLHVNMKKCINFSYINNCKLLCKNLTYLLARYICIYFILSLNKCNRMSAWLYRRILLTAGQRFFRSRECLTYFGWGYLHLIKNFPLKKHTHINSYF